MFPQLIAGPIAALDEIREHVSSLAQWNVDRLRVTGQQRSFMLGLSFRKVLIAD